MIVFKNVNLSIENKEILKNISFELAKNKILAIIGESGGGKTSIANILMKKIDTYKGEVYVDNKEIREYLNKEYYRKISIVLQDYTTALNPCMSMKEILYEPFQIKKKKINNEKIKEILKLLKLDYLDMDIKSNKLSGGEKQRLNIARILLFDPEILIFDESISSLDIDLQIEIVKIIRKISENMNKTILFITHNISILKFLTDDILVLKDGVVIERGDNKNPYTKKIFNIWKKD